MKGDKMKSIFENMSKLADDIVLAEQDAKKLYDSYQKRVENQKRKAAFMRKCYSAAAVIAVIIMFSATYFLQSPELVVYAATGGEMVQLKVNEKVYLEKEKTLLGEGYVLEISVEGGSHYYTIENEENLNAGNIFRNENRIIWMPDGMNTMDFRDQDGNVIQIPGIDHSTLHIKVCGSDGKEVERVTLILEKKNGQCSVEMLKQ